MTHVMHLTSVHAPLDVRILDRECTSLAEAGYDVTLVAPSDRNFQRGRVRVKAVPKSRRRLARMVVTTWRVLLAALRGKADLYHFHDTELIPVGLLLRVMTRAPVIYDVHEDNVAFISIKPYMPKWLVPLVEWGVDLIEQIAARCCTVIIAEKYYARRFPQATPVLNYPVLEPVSYEAPRRKEGLYWLLYTGSVGTERGAMIYARMVRRNPGIGVCIVGRCPEELAARMRREAGEGADRLIIEGVGEYVPHQRIQALYRESGWLAGLAVFPPNRAYVEKELTKFFEYMAAGLPILCSDFPVWRDLVEGEGAGKTVDPNDDEAIDQAISWLAEHPGEVAAMQQRGTQAARDRLNWASESKRLLALYADLVANR